MSTPLHLGISRRYLLAMFQFYFLVEGILGSMYYNGSLPLFFFYYKVSAIEYQKYLVLGMIMWNVVPLIGVVANKWPIMGYYKRTITLIAATLLGPATLGIVLSKNPDVAVIFFACAATCVATMSTTFNGQNAALILSKIASKRIAPLAQGFIMGGAILGVIMVGALADTEQDAHRVVYGFAACVPLVIPLVVSLVRHPDDVFLGDRKKTASDLHERLAPDLAAPSFEKKIAPQLQPSPDEMLLAVAMAFMSLLLLLITYNLNHDNVRVTFSVAVVMSVALLAYVARVYNYTRLAGLCVFGFVNEVLYADVTAAEDTFYTAPEICVPGGPNLGLLWYTSWTKTFAYGISLLMMAAYMRWAIHWRCRTAILFGVALRISSSLTDVIIGKHWNHNAHISDKSMYLAGNGMLNIPSRSWIQLSLVIAAVAPLMDGNAPLGVRGKEVLTMAIISGLQFMGQSVSRIYGMFLMVLFDFRADLSTGNCNVDNYVPLCIAAHVVSAIFLVPVAYAILP